MRQKVVVLGSNFGGLTAALAVMAELRGDVEVLVISPSDRFVFNPSLIWLPFGKRDPQDITFPVEPTLDRYGVQFVHSAATAIDPDGKRVQTADGVWYSYDYLVIATGYRNDLSLPGLTENAAVITTLEDAVRAGERWRRFLDDPGDVVVAAAPGTGCFGAAYEFLFNISHQLRKAGLKRRTKLSYVTAEPELGHFGLGGLPHGEALLGMFSKKERIDTRVGVALSHVAPDALVLADGTELPSKYTTVVPPFLGQQVVTDTDALDPDEKGFLPVRPTYQSEKHDHIYIVGIAAKVAVPWQTAIPVGVPKTGYPTEVQAHTAAANIAAQIIGTGPVREKPFGDIPAICVMDAGNNGVIILADKMLPPRDHSVLIPGPQAHLMKLAFEKYFLWKARNGYASLP